MRQGEKKPQMISKNRKTAFFDIFQSFFNLLIVTMQTLMLFTKFSKLNIFTFHVIDYK